MKSCKFSIFAPKGRRINENGPVIAVKKAYAIGAFTTLLTINLSVTPVKASRKYPAAAINIQLYIFHLFENFCTFTNRSFLGGIINFYQTKSGPNPRTHS